MGFGAHGLARRRMRAEAADRAPSASYTLCAARTRVRRSVRAHEVVCEAPVHEFRRSRSRSTASAGPGGGCDRAPSASYALRGSYTSPAACGRGQRALWITCRRWRAPASHGADGGGHRGPTNSSPAVRAAVGVMSPSAAQRDSVRRGRPTAFAASPVLISRYGRDITITYVALAHLQPCPCLSALADPEITRRLRRARGAR